MPRSFFVLARFMLRVDGVVVRLWDTRVWGRFQCSYLLRETSSREASFQYLAEVSMRLHDRNVRAVSDCACAVLLVVLSCVLRVLGCAEPPAD